ncbi:transposase Tn3 family protein [Burkholderia aenigmatica]|nr:transposase Tn3 family protein [Burkholderia aenigmatica]
MRTLPSRIQSRLIKVRYPVLPAEPGAAELKAAFTPSAAEIRFVRRQSRQEASAVLIMVQLKLLQRLGYFPMLVGVPPAIVDHIRTSMRARALSGTAIARYDVSGTRIRHQKLLRGWLDIRAFDASESASLAELASAEARTKIELPDIINVLIEELVRRRYELPPLATLQRIFSSSGRLASKLPDTARK